MQTQLFTSERLILTAISPDKDAEIESHWTHDAEYSQLMSAAVARPLSVAQLKKRYEEAEKDKSQKRITFAVRALNDDRLMGLAQVSGIEWNNSTGWLTLGFGAAADRQQGYGTEALRLLLRYAFYELNFHRVNAHTAEYNTGAVRWLEKAGFTLEARRRLAVNRFGRRWDDLTYGLLRAEWQKT